VEKREARGELVFTKYYVYGDFEFEGIKPFKHIEFKNFNRPAGCLIGVGTLPSLENLKNLSPPLAKL